MSLDGLRAWIGMVERKLTMRTRVFLVLVAIAIGGAGAGIYLGADAQSEQVTKADLRAVQEELHAEIETLRAASQTGAGGIATARLAGLTLQVKELQRKVESLEGKGK